MARMILGGYTFAHNPSGMSDLLSPDLAIGVVVTYNDFATFSWGAKMKGKPVQLRWKKCTKSQYDSMHALLVADVPVSFNPQNGSGKVYQVRLMSLPAQPDVLWSSTAAIVKDVVLSLRILDEGVAA